MKNNEKPDILNRIRNIKLKRELTVLLAFFVMLSTSYVMIHPSEALNNSTARTFMFFNEEEGTEVTAAPDMNALLDADRDAGATEEEAPAEVTEEQVSEETAYAEPPQTPAETVVPTLEPTVTPDNTAIAEAVDTLASTATATAEPASTSNSFSTAGTESAEETGTPEAASASPETTASAEPTSTPEATESPEPSPSATPEAEEVLYPAQSFTNWDESSPETKPVVVVTVEAPENALPEGTVMTVTFVEADQEILDKVENEVTGTVKYVQAVDITFTYQGKEIEPKLPIKVSMKSDLIRKATEEKNTGTDLIHIKEDKETEEKEAEKVEHTGADSVHTADDEITFESDAFSMYIFVGTELYTEVTLPGSNETYGVTVKAPAEAMIPEGSALLVTTLDENSEKYLNAKAAVIDAKKAENENFNEEMHGFAAVDISIIGPDGIPVEPAQGTTVSVSFEMKTLPESVSANTLSKTAEIIHLNDSTGVLKAETVAEAKDVKVESTLTADFTVDSFSTFVLKWDTDQSATIHFGKFNEETDEFDDFEVEQVIFDTSDNVGSVDIRNNFDGYSYLGANYTESGSSESHDIEPIIKHQDGKWYADVHTKSVTPDGEEYTILERTEIANGSDIYVYYVDKISHPSGKDDDTVQGPTTVKTVTDNHDGTQTITLDTSAPIVTEEDNLGANVLVVLDSTWSMAYQMGSTRRWLAAQAALNTLITTLQGPEKENDIDFALIDFHVESYGGLNRDTLHSWNPTTGAHQNSGTNYWTKNGDRFNEFIQQDPFNPNASLRPGGSDYNPSFTNWESPLKNALTVLRSRPDQDNTYVIFVTDGEPNHRENRLYPGYAWPDNVNDCISAAQDDATALRRESNVQLYGVFVGNDAGYPRLNTLISNAGGIKTINGTDEAKLVSEFEQIAHHIITNLGSSNVSVDDGITEMSSISAEVASGTAGGFEYFKKGPSDAEFVTWSGAPAASFSDDNGVTWDLSSVGTLAKDTTYRLQFKIWPSQAAYDMVANLDNGTVTITDLTEAQKDQIIVNVAGAAYEYSKIDHKWTPDITDEALETLITSNNAEFSVKTNTHLFTTYTYKGTTYTDPFDKGTATMPLDTDTIEIEKNWQDDINARNRADYVEFYLLVDGKYYQKDGSTSDSKDNAELMTVYKAGTINFPDGTTKTVAEADAWKAEEYIAPGLGTLSGNTVTALEDGHSYTLEEKAGYKWRQDDGTWVNEYQDYSMEFSSTTIRPMVIYVDGVRKVYNFVLIDEDHPAEDRPVYTLVSKDGSTAEYYYDERIPARLTADNTKTPELDITKVISEDSVTEMTDAELDEETFDFTVTFTFPVGSDPEGVGYWLYAPVETGGWTLPEYDGNTNYQPDNYTNGQKFFGDSAISIWGSETPPAGPIEEVVTKEITVTITRSQVLRFTNLPTGTAYEITESGANNEKPEDNKSLEDEGYTVDSIHAGYAGSGAIAENTEATVTKDDAKVTGTVSDGDTRYYHQFSNKLSEVKAELKVTKQLSGYLWAYGDPSYTFTLAAKEGTTPPMPDTADDTAGIVTVPVNDPAELTKSFGIIKYVEAGTYEYVISETAGTNENIEYGEPVNVKVIVEEVEGKLQVTSMTGEPADQFAFTAATAQTLATGTATIINKMLTGEITIVKEDDAGNALDGAVFKLLKGSENARYWDETDSSWKDVGDKDDPDYPYSFTVDISGKNIKGLPFGKYTLVELKAPDGHVIINKNVYFEIYRDSSDKKVKVRLTDAAGDAVEEVEGVTLVPDGTIAYKLTVENTPGSELPMTGGTGTLPYTLGGITVMLTALMYGFRMRRRERRLN